MTFLESSPLKLQRDERGNVLIVDSAGKVVPVKKLVINDEVDSMTEVTITVYVSGWSDKQ